MADSKVPTKQRPPLKTPPVPNIEAPYRDEKVWQYRQRIIQAQINRGSRYPPFSIEPMAWERMRVSKPMTDAERFLRKQWLQDQKLVVDEPVRVPLADVKCTARRLWALPMDAASVMVAKAAGNTSGLLFRKVVPKVLTAYVILIGAFYNITYTPKTWETAYGWTVSTSKKASLYNLDEVLTEPAFADSKFSERKVKNLPSSSVP